MSRFKKKAQSLGLLGTSDDHEVGLIPLLHTADDRADIMEAWRLIIIVRTDPVVGTARGSYLKCKQLANFQIRALNNSFRRPTPDIAIPVACQYTKLPAASALHL